MRTKEGKNLEEEVTVITMGGEKAVEALRTCLAVGADKSNHI